MKRIVALMIIIFSLSSFYVHAEESTPYLIHSADHEIEQIQQSFAGSTKAFQTVPMIEMHFTEKEKSRFAAEFPQANIYPVRNYETTEIPTEAPKKAANRYEMINAMPSITSPYTGKGVKVAILDTGIDNAHKHITVKGGTCTLKEKCSTQKPYNDDNGHGTHVAGIIAAQIVDSHQYGIAPNVELYAIKALNQWGDGQTTNIAAGVEWAILNNIDILNLSVETNMDDPALELVLEKAYNSGMLIIAAAGNKGKGTIDADSVQYPAKYPTVIAVSAIHLDGKRVALSSTGPDVELAAPGSNIKSTYPMEFDYLDEHQDGYTEMSGTSMAAPHVAGIAALYKERFPGMSNVALRELLTTTARDIGPTGRDEEYGYGLVQYKSSISGFPYLEIEEDYGKVSVSLANMDEAFDSKVTLDGLALEMTETGDIDLYLLAGTYQIELTYVDEQNKKHKEKIAVTVNSPKFTDVTGANWYAKHVAYLTHEKKIFGFNDDTFKPNNQITRAEAVALLGRVIDLNGVKRKSTFEDVGMNNFASGYIQSAYDEGIVTGFPDGSFRPTEGVTRAEMAILIKNAFKLSQDHSKPMPFHDMSMNMASYDAVLALFQNGITQGYTDVTFAPNTYMTRSTYSVFLAIAARPDLFQ